MRINKHTPMRFFGRLSGQHAKGMSLLEVLLVVGLMTTLITGAAQIFDDWFKKSINRKVASEMSEIQNAAEQYVTLNLEMVRDTMVPGINDIEELDITDMVEADFLPDGYKARNSFGQSIRVFVRNAGDNTVQGTAIEVISVADDLNGNDSRMNDLRLFDAALSGGPKLGLISAADLGSNCCRGNIQSAHGEWTLALSDFSAHYDRTPDVNLGGYMAAYGRVSMDDTMDDRYLFRVEMPGMDHLNRMMTNMDMNGRDIVNAGVVLSDGMQVDGTATFSGKETNGFSSPYVLAVGETYDGNGNLTVTANGNSKGDLIVQGDNNTSTYDLNIAGNVALPGFNGRVVTDRATVSTVQKMGSGVFDTMNVRGGGFNVNKVVAVNTQITGHVGQTNFLQTSTADVGTVRASNAVSAVTTVTGANTTLKGNLNANNNVAVTGNSNIGSVRGTSGVSIRDLTGCGNGCPPPGTWWE